MAKNISKGKVWSEEHIEKMLNLKEQGYSDAEIGHRCGGRTANSVSCKYSELKQLGRTDGTLKRKLRRLAVGLPA